MTTLKPHAAKAKPGKRWMKDAPQRRMTGSQHKHPPPIKAPFTLSYRIARLFSSPYNPVKKQKNDRTPSSQPSKPKRPPWWDTTVAIES